MIYKDLFKIKINGEEYIEEDGVVPKKTFSFEEMKKIYLDNLCRDFEVEYVPLLVSDILDDSEMYGGEYEGEEEDYED